MAKGIISTNGQIQCSKCGKTMRDVNFYQFKDGSKCDLCKACLTMHVNNWEPETFLWILEMFDVPYIPQEWNVLRDRAYAKDPYKMNGMSVIGKYMSKMKLVQWKKYTWADSEMLQKKAEQDGAEHGLAEQEKTERLEKMREMHDNGEITDAQWQTYQQSEAPTPHYGEEPPSANSAYPANSNFEQIDLPDVGNDLTAEDKIYLALKWGRFYKADEWVALEKLYNEFMNSFDIQGAARLDTLKKICKTSLKMDQAIDTGDIDTYQKLSRVYDSMMKAAKFTEAQNKEGKGDFVSSVGELVAYCEKEGGQIPRYEITVPQDVLDTVVTDLKRYNKSLIYEDKALAQEIEQYLKNKQAAAQMKRDREEAAARGLESPELEDNDYKDFREAIQQDIEQDSLSTIGEDEE